MKSNRLADLSRRPALLAFGLGAVAASASMLGAVVSLMLTGLAAPDAGGPVGVTASATPSPGATADPDPALKPETGAPETGALETGAPETGAPEIGVPEIAVLDGRTSAPAQPDAASAMATAPIPSTASISDPATIGDPETAGRATAGVTSRPPPDNLPPDLGPRVAHALEALEPAGFIVSAGSFVSERHAAALAETIAAVATPVALTPFVDTDGEDGWLVSAGPFADAATAANTAADIRRLVGIDPQIRPLERGE